jgi:hypothetical protein
MVTELVEVTMLFFNKPISNQFPSNVEKALFSRIFIILKYKRGFYERLVFKLHV